MSKKLTPQEVQKKINKRHGNIVLLDVSTYMDTSTRCKWIDKDYGKFWRVPESLFKGGGHPERIRIKELERNIIPIKKVIDGIEQTHGSIIKIVETSYKGVNKKALFVDEKYGEYKTLPRLVMEGRVCKLRAIENHKITVEEIEKRILSVHGEIVKIISKTFVGVNEQATFVDSEYGEWKTEAKSVLKGRGHPDRGTEIWHKKFTETCLKKYGVDHPSKNFDIALRVAKSGKKTTIKYHWKTNEELVCTASYECKVVDYLNDNRIDFQWQPKAFIMPNGKTYRPDLYLEEKNVWIEIKGYFREISKAKWDWFKSEYPTAQLWDKNKLKEMGIL